MTRLARWLGKEVGRLRTRPSPFGAGSAIRSNALLLQLDPDNPDEEAEEIARLARAHQQQLEDALQAQLAHIAAGNNPLEIQALADSLPESDLRLALETLLRESAGRGAIVTAQKLTQIAVGVNWQLANEMARVWANQYSYDLVSYITSNSRQFIAEALADWVQSGAPLADLIAQLGTRFDATRAELIASTEATRAYAEGSFTLYEQAGFNTRPRAGDRPPAHPRCRCFVSLMEMAPGEWHYVWYTVNDERVCPTCGARHLQSIGFAGRR